MKIRSKAAAALPFSLLALTAFAASAQAQINVKFQTPAPVYASSLPQTIAFTASLSNQFNVPIYLNNDFASMDTPNSPITIDDSPFQNTFVFPVDSQGNSLPQPFLPQGSTTTDTLFDLLIPGGTAAGDYSGQFVLQGGGDPFTTTDLASPAFTLHVLSAPVPEASTTLSFGLLLVLGSAALIVRRKKAQTV